MGVDQASASPIVWCPELAALDATERAHVARSLRSTQRLATLSALAIDGSAAVDHGPPEPCAELLGLFRFQRWLLSSERVVSDRGSPWWREVNGSMLLDLAEAVAAPRAADLSIPVAAWHRYLHHAGPGRVRAFWTAHQASLRAATAAARANLPSGGVGAHLIGAFCATCFPSTYRDGRSPARTRRERAVGAGATRTRRHVQRWAASAE